MKRILSIALSLTLLIMTGCGCKHTPGSFTIAAIDTASLTMTLEQICTSCGEMIETKETATGIAPADGLFYLSPDDWFSCLTTNIQTYGAAQSLMPVQADPQDNALLYSVVNLTGFKSAISFHDKEGTVFTTEQSDDSCAVNSIHLQAQFDNESATHFYMLLALIAITNNSDLTIEDASAIANQIMTNMEAFDNGYHYQLEITSVENHTVVLGITAE